MLVIGSDGGNLTYDIRQDHLSNFCWQIVEAKELLLGARLNHDVSLCSAYEVGEHYIRIDELWLWWRHFCNWYHDVRQLTLLIVEK